MKYIVIFCFLLNFEVLLAKQESVCNKNVTQNIDRVYSKMLTIGEPDRRFPYNQVEAQQYCTETRQLLSTAENHTKQCLKGMSKQMTSVMIYTIKNMANQICKKGSKRLPELLLAANCINTANNELQKCIVRFIDAMLGIKHADDKLKIPLVCCEYIKIQNCMLNKLKKINVCNESHSETTKQFMDSIMGNVIDLICGEYTESTDNCQKLGERPKKKKNQKRTRSIVLPIIDLFVNFAEV